MATEQSKTRFQILVPQIPNGKCELCEENDIAWKCLVCDQFMCHHCKKAHLKSKASQKHQVVSMDGASSQVKNWDVKCDRHASHKIERYCDQCGQIVCITCIADGHHRSHTFTSITDIMQNKGSELLKMIKQSKTKLTSYEDSIRMMRKNQSEFSDCISKCILEIKTRNSELKVRLDKITDDFIKNLQVMRRNGRESMEVMKNLRQKSLLSLKELVEKCEEKLKNQELEMIQFVADVKPRLDEYKSCEPPEPAKYRDFIHKDVDDMEFMKIFGHLGLSKSHSIPQTIKSTDDTPDIDVKITKFLSVANKDILVPVSSDKVWMGCFGSSGISLVAINGDVLQTVNADFNIYDLAVTKSGDVLATVYNGNKVKKLMPNNTFIDLYTAPSAYTTQGITVTDDNNILVCLYSKHRMGSKVVELSNDGQLITTIQFQSDGQTALFDESPWRVSSNRNGDLIVVQFRRVVVVDKALNKKFTYTGHVKGLKRPFNPWYVITNQYKHILISDFDNNVIHILDSDGNFVKYIRIDEHDVERPCGMCIDNIGRLWVSSSHSGKVTSIKYI